MQIGLADFRQSLFALRATRCLVGPLQLVTLPPADVKSIKSSHRQKPVIDSFHRYPRDSQRQQLANSVEKLDLKHSADWLCDEKTGFSNSWFSL
jgi:hypothetical protein